MQTSELTLSQLRTHAITILTRREHSVAELQQKLLSKGGSTTDVATVIAEMHQQGYLSDERFTEAFIQMRKRKGFGPLRIQLELQEKGVAADTISAYLVIDDMNWSEHAIAVRRKRFGNAVTDDFPTRARQSRFLQYRGFTGEQIRQSF